MTTTINQGASAPTHDARPFDPADWAKALEAVGGGWTGSGENASFFCIWAGRSRSERLECSRLIGMLDDDPAILEAVITYIKARSPDLTTDSE